MLDLTQFEGHTPGPWRCFGRYIRQDARVGPSTLIAMAEANVGFTIVESDANRSLLRSGPDLLAEVKRLRAALERIVASYEVPIYDEPLTTREIAKQALEGNS